MKRSWLVLGAVVLGVVVSQAACRNKAKSQKDDPPPPPIDLWGEQLGDEVPVPGGQVVVHLETEPPHLNLLIYPDGWTYKITLHTIYETLVREDPTTYAYVPGLAERWEVSDDNLVYTFHLRSGVRWHDGKPLSAKDVAFTIEKCVDSELSNTICRSAIEPFGCRGEAVDEKTFRLTCKKPYFLMLTGLDETPILPEHLIGKASLKDHPFNSHPVGTGPFKFERWTRGSEIVLARNDDYWGKKANLDRVVYLFVADPVMAVQLAAKGVIDFVSRVREPQWLGPVKTDPKIRDHFREVVDWPNQYLYMTLNCSHPALQDVRVRRALAHLFDLDRMLKDLMGGMGKRIATFFNEKSPGFDEGLLPYPFDRERAEQLLDEAGWKDTDGDGVRDRGGKLIHLTHLQMTTSPTLEKLITAYKEDLRKSGILLDIQRLEWGALYARLVKHDYDTSALGNVHLTPRIDVFENFHSSQAKGGLNLANFTNPQMDALLDKARVELDEARRSEVEHDIQKLAYDDLPYVPLLVQQVNAIVHKRFRNVKTSVEWYRIEDWWIPKRLQKPAR